MDEKRRKHRDRIQNILISLLSVTAVFLFAQTQLYNLGVNAGSSYFSQLTAPPPTVDAPVVSRLTDLAAPVRVVVSSPYGRCGSVTLTTADEAFAPLGGLLRDVLSSAQNFTPCTQEDLLEALSGTSVYYDVLSPLPLSVLAGMMGSTAGTDVSAQRLVITLHGESGTRLFLWDGGDRFLRADTAAPARALEETVGLYETDGTVFAFDSEDTADIAPASLLPGTLPQLPMLAAPSAVFDTRELLTALKFNPTPPSRYPESATPEVVVDGDRSLRISTDGTVLYRSGGDHALSIAAAEEQPTVQEAVLGAGSLLNGLLSSVGGDQQLYLRSFRRSGAVTTLQFDYQVGGVPIRFSDGGCAASVTLSGSSVTALTARLRQYTAGTELSLLLPLPQTLAIAAQHPGTELAITYVDNGTGVVSAGWLAE